MAVFPVQSVKYRKGSRVKWLCLRQLLKSFLHIGCWEAKVHKNDTGLVLPDSILLIFSGPPSPQGRQITDEMAVYNTEVAPSSSNPGNRLYQCDVTGGPRCLR